MIRSCESGKSFPFHSNEAFDSKTKEPAKKGQKGSTTNCIN